MRKLYILFCALIAGCGSYQTVSQTQEASYLALIGDSSDYNLQLDGNVSINLESADSYNENGKTVTRFEIEPGTHDVVLTQNGELKVHRRVFVTEGNSVEVRLP